VTVTDQRGKLFLSLSKRQLRQVLAIEFEKIESEIVDRIVLHAPPVQDEVKVPSGKVSLGFLPGIDAQTTCLIFFWERSFGPESCVRKRRITASPNSII
jgi:hypothetical protein